VSIPYWFDRQHANAPHSLGLLRACGERPSSRRSNKRNELSPFRSSRVRPQGRAREIP
jgi:hypothetical protein